MKDERSAIWGGATLGLIVGLILGFFVGTYWMTVLYSVGIGAASGVVANILGWFGDRSQNRRRTALTTDFSTYELPVAEQLLREHNPSDFEATPNAAAECVDTVCTVEESGWWRGGYDSLHSFYAAHDARHPDIRVYAAVRREPPVVEAFESLDLVELNWPEGLGATIVQLIAAHRAVQSPRELSDGVA